MLLTLGCTLGCAACRASEPAPSDASPTEMVGAERPAATATAATAGQTEPRVQPAPDPAHADQLRDLDDMCKAVDHDYADGTLRDYYSGLKLRTTWGTALRQTGDESTTPGRTLEQAAAELAVNVTAPGLEHCAKLFDYLDEVE
ncbi:hypothetical protein DB30_02970 [Enhygromyxa salina]|uniref:Uncharacterized protein n=1 Tax=Enhygromyxa salina TaxID=215803 RepID=A0A0C2D7X1_9BACT|nr:hypothetical protein DB30_02970 [Enhygromyxa salina]